MRPRSFLFLQGPHGPFFGHLAGMLRRAGHQICRIGFNAGDGFYWPHRDAYIPYTDPPDHWAEFLADVLDRRGITDIVLYADTRRNHSVARDMAQERGIRIHCFEEGYLRPYWITYERGGVNGNSRLMDMSIPQMRAMLARTQGEVADAPARWGALWHHSLYGAIYHSQVMFRNAGYRNFRPHRTVPLHREWWLNVRRLATMPISSVKRRIETRRLFHSGMNYHLVLLQLAHDASFRDHSDFGSIADFIDLCCEGFARGAPRLHRLVFKAHPLEDGREPLAQLIRTSAARHGVADRVQLIGGGKLAEMLDSATTAVTVNSTAAQQVLWRGLPLKAFGRSVYSKPEFVSFQPLAEFFANPRQPDIEAYRLYRRFLLATSQIPGSFYTAQGRARILRNGIDVILAEADPYETLALQNAGIPQQLAVS